MKIVTSLCLLGEHSCAFMPHIMSFLVRDIAARINIRRLSSARPPGVDSNAPELLYQGLD